MTVALSAIFLLVRIGTPAGLAGPDEGAAIAGRVIDWPSNRGLPFASVRLYVGDMGNPADEVATDEGGNFSFVNLSPAEYFLESSKDGYVTPEILRSARGIVVRGNRKEEVRLALVRSAIVSGIVMRSNGEPMVRARVEAIRRSGPSPRAVLRHETAAVANDRGEYRLFGLPPGWYWVVALPFPDARSTRGYAPVFFPGVTDPAKAESIFLRAAEIREGTNLTFLETDAFEVGGAVTDSRGTGYVAAVALVPADGLGIPLQTTTTDGKGRFQFHAVPAGSYQVLAAAPVVGRSSGGFIFDRDRRFGRRRVEASQPESKSIEVPLSPGVALKGRIELSPPQGGSGSCTAGLQVSLHPVDGVAFTTDLMAKLDGLGRFAFRDLPHGTYRVVARGFQGDCFLQAVQLGSDQPRNGVFTLGDGTPQQLTLIVGRDGASLKGTISDGVGAGAPHAVIALVRADLAEDFLIEDVIVAQANDQGMYRLQGLAPARYRAIALIGGTPDLCVDPLFWKANAGLARDVDLSAGGEHELNLIVLAIGR